MPPKRRAAPSDAPMWNAYTKRLAGLGLCWLADKYPVFYLDESGGEADYCLVLAHGNAVDAEMMVPTARQTSSRNKCAVVLVEYPGYGPWQLPDRRLEELTTVENAVASVVAVCASLVDGYGWPADRLVLAGHSLGSGVALQAYGNLRASARPAGLVLLTPFASVKHMAAARASALAADLAPVLLDSEAALGRLGSGQDNPAPAGLVIVGALRDKVVPPEHSQLLFDVAAASTAKGSGPAETRLIWREEEHVLSSASFAEAVQLAWSLVAGLPERDELELPKRERRDSTHSLPQSRRVRRRSASQTPPQPAPVPLAPLAPRATVPSDQGQTPIGPLPKLMASLVLYLIRASGDRSKDNSSSRLPCFGGS